MTAFNVQSYVNLQPNQTVEALRSISTQLERPPSIPIPDFTVLPTDVWINALWFSSLICSLSAALLCILVKQWLHTYDTGISGDSQQIALLRQYRLDNLEKWRVPAIVATISILLLASVIIFLAGLLVLLWTLNPVVAAVSTSLAAILLAVLVFTTIMPTFSSGCSYLSPQSEIMIVAGAAMIHSCRLLVFSLKTLLRSTGPLASMRWLWYKHRVSDKVYLWCLRVLGSSRRTWAWPNWHVTEQLNVAKTSDSLKTHLAVKAYATTLDDGYLENTMTRCIADVAAAEPDPQVLHCWHQAIERTRGSRSDGRNSVQYDRYRYFWLETLFSLNAPLFPDGSTGHTTTADDVYIIIRKHYNVMGFIPAVERCDGYFRDVSLGLQITGFETFHYALRELYLKSLTLQPSTLQYSTWPSVIAAYYTHRTT